MQSSSAELRCRLIVDPPARGAWNMAVDEALLDDAIEHGIATLRLYQWSEPTLSLGYFQRYEDRFHHVASRDAAIVRRQSGGGAILHDRELTYSLTLPATHPLARQAEQLYLAVHEAFVAVLAPWLGSVAPGWQIQLRCGECEAKRADEPFLCFLRRARGDLVLLGQRHGVRANSSVWKILGSAQRRRQGAILQHGSLVLERSPSAPEIAGICDVAEAGLSAAELIAALPESLSVALRLQLQVSIQSDRRRNAIAALEAGKYAAPGWTKRR